jgi:hypothetical protein
MPETRKNKIGKYRWGAILVGVLAVALWFGLDLGGSDSDLPPLESYLTDKHKDAEGNYGPVPTGAPDDPFNITTIEGDGWRMYDSGPGLKGGGGSFYWINEKQVFFLAENSPQFKSKKEKEKNRHEIKYWFYLWDLEKGVKRLDHLPVDSWYCYSEGKMFVGNMWRRAKKGNKKLFTVRDGEIREDNALAEQLGRNKPTEHFGRNEFQCNYITSKGKYSDLSLTGLKQGDGQLSHKFDTSGKDRRPVILFNPQKGIDQELPIFNHDITPSCARYFEFKGAYFLYDCLARTEPSEAKVKKWKVENCLSSWWLWPDGRTEKLCIPYGPWSVRNTWHVIPTARGLFLNTRNFLKNDDPEEAGGYLFQNGQLKKIVSGVLGIPEQYQNWVSPDGCRVAFGYAPTWNAWSRVGPGRYTTRILDVCVDENG